MKNLIAIIFLAIILSGCEKVVDLKYKDNQSVIVIEGNISNEAGPYYVKISKSVPLSDIGVNPTVDNAVVRISDDAGNIETLMSQGSGMYKTASLKGAPGRTYTLTVQAENQSFTAKSTMPAVVALDSVRSEQFIFASDTAYLVVPVYLDPVATGNNYHFLMSVNGKAVNQHLIQSDEIRNGLVNLFGLQVDNDETELKTGDQITLTMQCVDSNVGLYYKTLVLMSSGGPNGGTTPVNPPGNLSNGALGLFSAHTSETKSLRLR